MKSNNYWKPEAYRKIQKNYQYKNGLHLISKLKKIISLKNKNILDIGCGLGNLTFKIYKNSNKTSQIDGVDIDKNMINYAKNRYKINNFKFYNEDIIDFLNASVKKYDIIFSNAAIHWLNNISFSQLINLIKKKLSPNGIIGLRFSLINNGKKAKDYLQNHLRIFLNNNSIKLAKSSLEYNKCFKEIRKGGFDIKFSREISYSPFKNTINNYHWLIYSQPIFKYLKSEKKYNDFCLKLLENWKKDKINVNSHHMEVIAEKI